MTDPRTPESSGGPGASQGDACESPRLPDALSARYICLGLHGSGGMGHVFRVRDRALDEVVALKLMRPELADCPQMRREVKRARRITHPAVARTYDLGEVDGHVFLTMEYIDGQPLDVAAVWSVDAAVEVLRAIAAGIDAAHSVGVVHRDLKPANVMRTPQGRVVLVDFGLADLGHSHGDAPWAGTPPYMAPEQSRRGRTAPPADIHAWGVIAYELLTGAPYTRSPRRLESVLPHSAVELADLLEAALAMDPRDRPTADALLTALAGRQPAPGSEPAGPERRFPVSRPARIASLAVLPFLCEDDASSRFLADGLVEDVIDAISFEPEVAALPFGAVRLHRPEPGQAASIGRSLGVGAVVSGSLRRIGDRIRIRAELVSVHAEAPMWQERFDCEVRDLFDVSDTLARRVVGASSRNPPRAAPSEALRDVAERHLRTRQALRVQWHGRATDLEQVVEDFQELVEQVPGSGRVVAGAALAWARFGFRVGDEALKMARHLGQRAVDLAPLRADGHVALALSELYGGRPDAAVAHLQRAVACAPDHDEVHGLMGRVLLERAGPSIAVRHLQRAVHLNPHNLNDRWDLARAHAYLGDWSAVAGVLSVSPVSTGEQDMRRLTLWRLALWRGQGAPEDSTAVGERDDPLGDLIRAYIQVVRSGRLDDAHRTALVLAAEGQHGRPRLWLALQQHIAELEAAAGEWNKVVARLDRAVGLGLADVVWLEQCPLLAAVDPERRAAWLTAADAAGGAEAPG